MKARIGCFDIKKDSSLINCYCMANKDLYETALTAENNVLKR